MKIAVQISPEAKSAYFADYLDVAKKELELLLRDRETSYLKKGNLEFFIVEDEGEDLGKLLRLSFVQGVYKIENGMLIPLDMTEGFNLHEDFVFGSKYKGKTNERLTQMLINVGLASVGVKDPKTVTVLDPMCGRGTTLLWAMRYGLSAKGIEQDPQALVDIRRNLKKWTKLQRQKHRLTEGFINGKNRSGLGKYLEFATEDSSMRVVTEDSRNAKQVFRKEKFDLIISDLPYGVQHFTTKGTRNPLKVIEESIEGWKGCLKNGGVVVLAFNSNNPKRAVVIESFEKRGFRARPFSAGHRMSESIVRDVVIFEVEK